MKERINITVEPQLLDRIDEQARAEHTSRSALIRRVMRGYVDGERSAGDATSAPGLVAETPATYAPREIGASRALAPVPSLDDIRPVLHGFFAGRDDVETAWLFGSVAGGRTWEQSDVDIAVLPSDQTLDARAGWDLRADLSARLEQLLG
jgi:predicted nucleotidyltransferase/predicted transcriptional regulator